MPGIALLGRVNVHVLVPGIERIANVGLRVGPEQLLRIPQVDAAHEQRPDQVIERRLAALLLPCSPRIRPLDGQRAMLDDVLDHKKVIRLVRGLKDRRDHAIDHARDQIEHQPPGQRPALPTA